MRCRRCQSTIVESRVEENHSSAQTWVTCSLCGSQSIQTRPASSTAGSASKAAAASTDFSIDSPETGYDSSFDVTPTSSSVLRY